MIKSIELSDSDLEFLKKTKIDKESYEGSIHPITINGKVKLLKIFFHEEDIKNKIKKLNLIKDKKFKLVNIINADYIATNNGNPIGYIMPIAKGKPIEELSFYNNERKILILKELKKELQELHNKGIVIGDFTGNILIDDNNNLFFIDTDNYQVDNLKIDKETILLKKYFNKFHRINKDFDNYMINILTIHALSKIQITYMSEMYNIKPELFLVKDEKINHIIDNTLSLKSNCDQELIIDEIETKKDMKKLRKRLF